MLVSFVIPAYNAAATLQKTVESLQAQTVGNWEAIIVDDGSTDDTLLIAKRLAAGDTRLRVIAQSQAGEGAARNAGIDAARGDGMVFLDSDDWLLPAYLECMVPALAADPGLDAVHCGHYLVTADGQRGPDVFPWWSSDLFEELSRRNVFAIHTCLVRHGLVQAIGHFDVSLRTATDWDFWQRVARTGAHFGAVHEALACYLMRPGSATSDARQILVDGLTIIERGHQADPRIARPAVRYSAGMPADELSRAKLYYLSWAAGLAIGKGQDALPLLASIADKGVSELSPRLVAEHLYDAVPWPTGRLHADWGELWPHVAPAIDAYLAALEARTLTPDLAQRAKHALKALAHVSTSEGSLQTTATAASIEAGRDAHQRRVAELEQARVWLEQQVANWRGAVAERDQQIEALKAWIDELEAGKTWLEAQRQHWMRLADKREQQPRWSIPLALPRWLRPGPWRAAEASIAPAELVDGPVPEAPSVTDNPGPAAAATREPEPAARTEPLPPAGPFGSPRHVTPLSREWGYDRGLPIDRYYIEGFLARYAGDVRGRVLEVGDNSYTQRFGGERVWHSDVLNFATGHPQTTFVADLAQGDNLPSEAFDCIILTQTLQLIYDTRAALATLGRILKLGGVMLLTCPGLTRTSQTEWPGSWYWRFSPSSLSRMLAEVLPSVQAEVESHGNVLAASAFLYGLAANELSPAELDYHDVDFDVILTVRAVKRGSRLENATAQPSLAKAQPPSSALTLHSARQSRQVFGAPAPPEARGLVLLYHRVAAAAVDPWSIAVTPERFGEQLQVLRRVFQPVRLGELAQALEHPAGGRPPVAITFDDGYADNLHAALPLLEKHGLPATFFVTTGGIAQRAEFWWDTLERLLLWPGMLPTGLRLTVAGRTYQWQFGEWAVYSEAAWTSLRHWPAYEAPPTPRQAIFLALWELLHPLPPETLRLVMAELQAWGGPAGDPRQRALGLEELQGLARSKLADFGGHTVTHPSLAALPLNGQRAEIMEGARWLAEAVGRPVSSFSYPFGKPVHYGPETVALVRAAGFGCACANTAGAVRVATDPYQLPRLHVGDWDGDEFERRLRSWLEW